MTTTQINDSVNMSGEAPGTVISLTYHEITADPRVLKQARALRSAGYDVHIFCDWPDGFSEYDEIDGIRITRFRCFGIEGITRQAFHSMDFLDASKETIADRYLPYAAACEFLSTVKPAIEERFGPKAFDLLKSSYFRKHKGFERLKRMVAYLQFHLSLRNYRATMSSTYGDTDIKKTWAIALADWRNHRGRQYQAQSIAFWSNISRLDFRGRYAAIHAHDIYCLPAGVMLSRRFNVPLIYDAHEYEPARATKIASDEPEMPELIENDCFQHIDRMITVSEGIADLYEKRYQGPRPEIVMNAPEIDFDADEAVRAPSLGARTVRDMAGLAEGVPLVVATGAIQRGHRGMDKVLEALARLPDTHLASLGPRHDSNDNWFLGYAKDLGIEDRVTLLPPVDARDVPTAISTADVSVCAFQDVSLNHRLAMPNKLFEAAFAGVPICVSDLPEMRRFVETLGIGRVMDQTCPESIANAVSDVIENRDTYRMTPETRRKLADIYSWQRQAEKLLALYHELVGPPGVERHKERRSAIRAAARPSP